MSAFARLGAWLDRRYPPRVTIDSVKTLELKPGQILVITTHEALTAAHIDVIRKSLGSWSAEHGVKIAILEPGWQMHALTIGAATVV